VAGVSLPPTIGAVTLACRDLGRMAAFYRQFGWPEAPTSVPEHVVFQCRNGVVLGLFAEHAFAVYGEPGAGFRGVSIGVQCSDAEEVDRAHEEVAGFDDVEELEDVQRSGFGCGFRFRDPETNVWEIAWKAGGSFDDRGGFHYP
jgi:predicted lactoylglutathione lyase